jgi:hypothetical protein
MAADSRESEKSNLQEDCRPAIKNPQIRLLHSALAAKSRNGFGILHGRLVQFGCRFDLICEDPLNGLAFTPTHKLLDLYEWSDGGIEILEGSNEPNLLRSPLDFAISADYQRSLYRFIKSTLPCGMVP